MGKTTNILAFEYYGSKLGKNYLRQDLETNHQIEALFDLAQILRVYITALGWQHLLEEVGIKRIYQIDKVSAWFDTEDKKDWISSIYYHALIAGYNPIDQCIGQWDEASNCFESTHSKSTIDWNYINSLSF